MFDALKNEMLGFNVQFRQLLGDKHTPNSPHDEDSDTKIQGLVSFEIAVQTNNFY